MRAKSILLPVVALGLLWACGPATGGDPSWASKPAPDASLAPLTPGGDVAISSFKGKVVLLDFWATWCGPCKAIMPKLSELHKKYGSQGLEVMGITDEDRPLVQEFRAKNSQVSYPFYLDSSRVANTRYNVEALPTSVLIDKKGIVRGYFVGGDPNSGEFAKLEELIKQALAE